MKKVLAIAATAMLIGSSGVSFAGSTGTKGASGSAPGTQMNNVPGSRGASELSPGDKMRDSSTTGMSRGATKGASEFTPGDKMNDTRRK